MTVYKAVAGIDAVRLDDGAVLLRGDLLSCRLEGESAVVAADRLLPALGDWRTADALKALLSDYSEDDVEALIGELVAAGLVRRRSAVPDAGTASTAATALAAVGIDEGEARRRLAGLEIGLIGLDRVGLLVATALCEAGIGGLVLADPVRQESVGDRLKDAYSLRVRMAPLALDRAAVESFAADLDLLVVTVDRAFLAARHWANRAALAGGSPVMFADLSVSEVLVGPTVLPGESACYMCFRMRHLATFDRFADIYAYEQFLDAKRDPAASRALLPGLAETAAGLLVGEAIRLLFGPLVPSYVNAVVQLDAAEGKLARHQFLRQPECPHCRHIDKAVRTGG